MQDSCKPKAVFAWSGGKDSAFCLYQVLLENEYEVAFLLTTLNLASKQISMHGVKEELLDLQSNSIGIPQLKVWIDEDSFSSYEQKMSEMLLKIKAQGIEHVIFGDIFLDDLREYRVNSLKKLNMHAIFPLWKKDTRLLIQNFIDSGFKTLTCCTNDAFFNEEWVGINIDKGFIDNLPCNVDPCGENGEYHTFCYAGPIFSKEINIVIGEKTYRPVDTKNLKIMNAEQRLTKGFWYCELNAV